MKQGTGVGVSATGRCKLGTPGYTGTKGKSSPDEPLLAAIEGAAGMLRTNAGANRAISALAVSITAAGGAAVAGACFRGPVADAD